MERGRVCRCDEILVLNFIEFVWEFVSPLADDRVGPRTTADAPEPSADRGVRNNRGRPRTAG